MAPPSLVTHRTRPRHIWSTPPPLRQQRAAPRAGTRRKSHIHPASRLHIAGGISHSKQPRQPQHNASTILGASRGSSRQASNTRSTQPFFSSGVFAWASPRPAGLGHGHGHPPFDVCPADVCPAGPLFRPAFEKNAMAQARHGRLRTACGPSAHAARHRADCAIARWAAKIRRRPKGGLSGEHSTFLHEAGAE